MTYNKKHLDVFIALLLLTGLVFLYLWSQKQNIGRIEKLTKQQSKSIERIISRNNDSSDIAIITEHIADKKLIEVNLGVKKYVMDAEYTVLNSLLNCNNHPQNLIVFTSLKETAIIKILRDNNYELTKDKHVSNLHIYTMQKYSGKKKKQPSKTTFIYCPDGHWVPNDSINCCSKEFVLSNNPNEILFEYPYNCKRRNSEMALVSFQYKPETNTQCKIIFEGYNYQGIQNFSSKMPVTKDSCNLWQTAYAFTKFPNFPGKGKISISPITQNDNLLIKDFRIHIYKVGK